MKVRTTIEAISARLLKRTSNGVDSTPDERIKRLQLLLQSPYPEEREKALQALRNLKGQHHVPAPPNNTKGAIERVVLVLDRSDSMGTRDYPPNRLDAAVRAALELVEFKAKQDPRDEVGIVSFHQKGQVHSKLIQLDRGMGSLTIGLRKLTPYDGTNIDAGLREAAELLQNRGSGMQDRIVLLTDGHGGNPLKTAKALKDRGVVIDVVGIGGSPKDVDEKLLRKVASIINGDTRYRFIGDRAALFEHFRQLANKLVL